MVKPLLRSLALATLALLPAQAQAGIAFDDFGPNDAFNPVNGYVVAGAAAGPIDIAAQFTAGESGELAMIRLALGQVAGTNAYTVSLLTDAGDTPGSTVLETFSLTGVPEFGAPYTPSTLTSVLHPYLSSGAKYWIEIEAVARDTTGTWNFNSIGLDGLILQTGGDVMSFTAPAFSVSVGAVPEPSSMMLCGIAGLVGYAGFRRRNA